jgi:hypothetical protein
MIYASETKLDKRIALACTVFMFVLTLFAKFAPLTTLGLSLAMMGILLWRIILFYRRKHAAHRRVLAYWERPESRDQHHIVNDVMHS